MTMLVLRSFLFNLAFYANLIIWMVAVAPAFVLPRKVLLLAIQAWARSSLWLLHVIAGTRVEFRGLDRIPPGGLLVAAKHQSLWETFALLTIFSDPAFVLKRELMWIPLFGWYCWKCGMVPINRKAGSSAITELKRRAQNEVKRGRQILIFPEGTRRAPGQEPAYKHGVAHLYETLDVPCLPVALNSGLYWPRRRFIRRPGTIIVEVLDPIPPGLSRERFAQCLQERLEGASNSLLAEGRAKLGLGGAVSSAAPSRLA
jgi:1-acyl-sn-glycerol-3-phosphate acyltransferase